MPLNGAIERKLRHLDERLTELRAWELGEFERFAANRMLRAAVERVLQVSVEIVIDVCERLLALAGVPPAETSAENLRRLGELGAFSNADAFVPMIQFRNFIVHRYEDVDAEIVYDIVTRHLADFDAFATEIRKYCEERDEPQST